MSTKPWGGAGSWAAEAEQAEAEEQATAAANPQLFPSLKEAVTTKPKKKKPMTLSEFNSFSAGPTNNTRLTPDEMLQLPTGPKLRSPDEPISRGFSSYGGPGGSGSGGPRRGGGGFDGNRRGERDYDAPPPPPSRADQIDDWGAMKRSSIPVPSFDRERERGPASSSRYEALGGGSRADDVDNWNLGKKAAPMSSGPARSSGFGSGFRDSGSDWRRGDQDVPPPVGRTRLVLDPPRNVNNVNGSENVGVDPPRSGNKPSPFGAARPREEVLAEKGVDWKKVDLEIEAKKGGGSRPGSSQGSRPTSSHSNVSESLEVKPRVKVNPFGEAKPREVLLEEKGLDWRKIDLELEQKRFDRPLTDEEKALKNEIESLKKDLEKENDGSQGPEGDQPSLHDVIQIKERELENLTKELDDKLRFGQKAVERPGSGAGRPGSGAGRPGSGAGRPGSGAGRPGYMHFSERPPAQFGSFDDGRGVDAMDRPRSRGTGDVWSRPGEERRGSFQGGRDGGFQSGGFQGGRDGGFRDGGFQGGRDGGFRDGSYQGGRDGGYQGGGFQGGRDGGFQGGRDGGFQGGRDGGFQGGRDGGFQGGRDGGFQGGRDRGFQSNRDFNRSTSRERW